MRGLSKLVSLALAAGLCAAPRAVASLIQIPFISPRDGSMAGNVVATPWNGGSILLTNPAGVVGLEATEVEASVFMIRDEVDYENPEAGYRTSSSELPMAPVVWLGTQVLDPWYAGVGLYGTTGASFNFAGSPAIGIENRFLSELTVIQLGIVAGREVMPGLRVALELSPTYGKVRARFGSPLGPVRFDTDGAGIGGSAGLLYDLGTGTTLGLSYRSPAVVWLRGDGNAGPTHTDADLDLHLPQSVAFGLAHAVTERLTVAAQARWTDYPEFEEGGFEFSNAPALNQPFIRSARSTFRWGAGLEYAVHEIAKLRCGFSREEWMIEEEAMSPLLLDGSDILATAGLGIDVRPLRVDFMVGLPTVEDRIVTADRSAFPGRYEHEGLVWSIGAGYRF